MAEYKGTNTASWNKDEVRRAQENARRRKKKKPVRGAVAYALFIVLTSAILAGVGWLLASDLCAFNKDYATATVEVTADDTLGSVARKLHDAGLIRYKWFFHLFGTFSHADDKIGIGTYELNTDMDYRALILNMHNSSGNLNAATVTVTIPEGYTVAQTIHALAEKGVNTEEALWEAARTGNFRYDFIDNSTDDPNRLEGYLFPDTYEFYKGHNAKSALDKLIKTFDSKLDRDLLEKAKANGYRLRDVVIIASLIEKETDGTDHANIASVIYNRMKDTGAHGTYGMLQIDASVLYGLGAEHEGGLTQEDLKKDTPYNLYLHAGLPPTPIANPGLDSLNAAMEPNATNYYFYALGKDGKHHFSETLEEHNRFVASDEYGG